MKALFKTMAADWIINLETFKQRVKLLGGGQWQRFEVYFTMPDDAWFTFNETNSVGQLKYEYFACGGWRSNKVALNHIAAIEKSGYKVMAIFIEPTHWVYGRKFIDARKRFAHYKQSGVSIKTAKIPVV